MTQPGLIDTGLKVSIFQVIRAVREKLLLISAAAAVAGIVIYQLLATMPPVYTATAVLWYDDRENRLLASDSAWSSLQEQNRVTWVNEVAPIVKETEVMDSLPIYNRIIAELDLAERPEVLLSDRALMRRAVKDRILMILPASIVAALRSSDETTDQTGTAAGAPPSGASAENANDLQTLEFAQGLGSIIRITPNELTSVISVRVTSPDAQAAAEIANAVPVAYKAEYNDRVTLASRAVVELLSSRVEAVRERLVERGPSISPDEIVMGELTREADTELLRSLLLRLNEVQQLQNIESRPVHVLSPATLPTEQSGAGAIDFAITGFFGVLLFGIGLVTLRELLNDRLRFPGQIEEKGLEIMAVTPKLTAAEHAQVLGEDSGSDAPAGPGSPTALFSEAMRRLMVLTAPDEAHGSVALLLASSAPGDGVSTTALGLARTIGRSGKKAVVVETDLSAAPQEDVQHAGLAGVLKDEVPIEDALVRVETDGAGPYWVLPAASDRSLPSELLASERMKTLMRALREQFDVVILDATPVSQSADSEVLARCCDGTVLIIRYGTKQKLIRASLDLMDRVSNNPIGVVVTHAPDVFFEDLYGSEGRKLWPLDRIRAITRGGTGARPASPFAAIAEQQTRNRNITKLPARAAATKATDTSQKNVN